MTDQIVFYTNPMSRGRMVRWMLEELGVPYRTQMVEYGPAMKSPEYLRINPMGKVPSLVHGETIVTECAAICAYLADAFPAAGLAPALAHRGDYYRWLFFAAGPVEAAVSSKALGFEPDEKQRMTVGFGSLGAVIDTLENAVKGRRHIAGTDFSAADVYVGSQIGWGLAFGTMDKRQALVDYWEGLAERPACKRAGELDDAAA